jgi:O-antigen/teichoic acid export membrane protein
MSLRLAASAGALQTLVTMVLSFASIKVTSVYLGPAGIGTLGQLTYFIALAQAVLAAGLHTGLVRRIAELGDDRAARERAISTALRSLLAVGVPVAAAIALASDWIARELLYDARLGFALRILGAVFVLGLLATVITACANGAKDFRTVALINIASACASFAMILALCPRYGLVGGLIATASLPLATGAIAWAVARRHAWWPRAALSHGFSRSEIRVMTAFVPMAVITAVGMPLVQLLIRDGVVAHSGLAAVGLLQGVMRISEMYLGVASGVFGMYFFPRFSEISDVDELVREVRRGLLLIVPSVALVSVVIYLLRDLVVRVVFSPDFVPMRDLFGWQMIGNTLKMVGWMFGYVLLAKTNALAMAALELATLVAWWLLATYLVARHGVLGATEAYAAIFAGYASVTMVAALVLIRRMRLSHSRGVAT